MPSLRRIVARWLCLTRSRDPKRTVYRPSLGRSEELEGAAYRERASALDKRRTQARLVVMPLHDVSVAGEAPRVRRSIAHHWLAHQRSQLTLPRTDRMCLR